MFGVKEMGGCLTFILILLVIGLFGAFPIRASILTVLLIIIFIVWYKKDTKATEEKLRLDRESFERAKRIYNEAISKINIPRNALKIIYKRGGAKLLRTNYIWIKNNNLCFFPSAPPNTDAPSNVQKIRLYRIPVDKIEYYSISGETIYENKITGGGGGGSSTGGAIVGGVIAGEVGAVIGSRKKTDPIESKLIKHDDRETFLSFFDNKNIKHSMFFDFESYNSFNELLPKKAFEIVNAIKTNRLLRKSLGENNFINVTDRIGELARLKEEGIITNEEFPQKKKLLLEKIT